MNHYYRVLDVPPNATPEQLKTQYKQLVRIYHPDRFRDPRDKEYAEQKLREINEAYEALSNLPRTVENPPRPVATPAQLNFGSLAHGRRKTMTFQVDNLGGPAKSMNFIYSDQDSWFKVAKGTRVYAEKPVPVKIEVMVETEKLDIGKSYEGWLDVEMDGFIQRVDLSVAVTERQSLGGIFNFSNAPARLTLVAASLIMVALVGATMFFAPWQSFSSILPDTAGTSGGSSVTIAPSDVKLAFAVYEENDGWMLYMSDADGTNQESLGINGWSPMWSPDNKRIAYISDETGVPQIYILNQEDQSIRQLTKGVDVKSNLTWSPDGRRLAYISGDDTKEDVGGTLQVADILSGQTWPLTSGAQGDVQNFVWNPDSHHLLFDLYWNGERRIYQTSINGGDLQIFTHFDSWGPAISSNGEHITVSSGQGLYTMDPHGRDLNQLNEFAAWAPSWSHDDKKIAFLAYPENTDSETTNKADLWVMEADGFDLRRLTTSGVLDYAWSPNSLQLAYVTGNLNTEPSTLYLWVVVPGNAPQLIAEVNESNITWTY
ncbi:MAG: DnaJ domain-containing protein [Chloroflexota bacterium]